MKSTAQKLVLISFILALIASLTFFMYLQSLKSPKEMTKKTSIIVAVDTIPARTLISKKMLKEIKVDSNSYFGDYIKDASKIVGKYTKETILKNEGFQTDKLLDKDENELSLNFDNNYRAISISVTGDSGVSDLLKPGDYVDIIAYLAEKKDGTKIVRADVAKIILQNIEILAVDKQINRVDKETDNSTNNTSNNDKAVTNFLVTLSVPTTDLEKLVLSESIGTIKLALRPLQDSNTIQTNGTTWKQLSINVDSDGTIANNQEISSDISTGKSTGNEKYSNYTAKLGDTLKKISKKFYGDESKYPIIKEANNIEDENLILAGEVIKIPKLQQ